MNFSLSEALPVLERTPTVVSAMLDGLGEDWIRSNEGPDTWSPFDVVGHLIHGERTDWIPRARIILAPGDDRRFVPFDRFAHFRESEGKSLRALLDEFAHLRAQNIETLRGWSLGDDELTLTGIHPAFGSVTMRQLLAAWVVHDLGHIAQIARVMAKRYREAIGPWTEYLTIVDR